MGKYTIPGVIASFPDANSYGDTLKDSRSVFRNGSIGGEILGRFTVIFNFPTEKIYFKRNSSFNKEFHYNLSGITVKARGEDLHNFEITDVRENSSAHKANVKTGDSILAINGERASELDLNKADAILNSRPGKRIVLEVEREGKTIVLEFMLVNQI